MSEQQVVPLRQPLPKAEVVKAIERRWPARVPVWWTGFISPECAEKYGEDMVRLKARYPDDFVIFAIDSGRPADFLHMPEWQDKWGITWRRAAGGVGGMPHYHPLHDGWEHLDQFLATGLPDADRPGLLDPYVQAREANPDSYLVGTWWLGHLEMFRALRGVANMCTDFHLEKENVWRLGEALSAFFLRWIDRFARCGFDGVLLSDDFGIQKSLLMSPATFREFFKPWYRQMIERIHGHGIHALLHSCGNVTEIVPDLIEIGLDVLHPIQAHAMDQAAIAQKYRGKLSFFGGLDMQDVLPHGTPAEIDEHVRWLIHNFATPEGGYLLAPGNNIGPDVPLQNIEAFCQASLRHAGSVRSRAAT